MAVFGHSLGALLAFEFAVRLERAGRPATHVFASGSPTPWNPRLLRASNEADDDVFLARVEEFSGSIHPMLHDPEMRDMYLPALRADTLLYETYSREAPLALASPITTMRGATDDLITPEQCAGWSTATVLEHSHHEFDGGHMYLDHQGPAMLAFFADSLAGKGPGVGRW